MAVAVGFHLSGFVAVATAGTKRRNAVRQASRRIWGLRVGRFTNVESMATSVVTMR